MTVDINLNNNLGTFEAGTPRRMPGVSGSESAANTATSTNEAAETVNAARAQGQATQRKEQEQSVRESVEKLNEFIRPYVTSLQFSIDKDAGKFVVKILDTETKEVIKQFPSEKVLALAKALAEAMSKPEGLLVEQDA
ncbi:MAG: flagellar protein FlaG [Azoarcus sp.]|jgi:flagellar protein FlaG|nr:flagellar protein FlaG [Azoarcus sp.]